MGKEWSRNRWNAYRQPTQDEIGRGHASSEMVWVGAAVEQSDAAELLRQHGGGHMQFDRDGDIVPVNEKGWYEGADD